MTPDPQAAAAAAPGPPGPTAAPITGHPFDPWTYDNGEQTCMYLHAGRMCERPASDHAEVAAPEVDQLAEFGRRMRAALEGARPAFDRMATALVRLSRAGQRLRVQWIRRGLLPRPAPPHSYRHRQRWAGRRPKR